MFKKLLIALGLSLLPMAAHATTFKTVYLSTTGVLQAGTTGYSMHIDSGTIDNVYSSTATAINLIVGSSATIAKEIVTQSTITTLTNTNLNSTNITATNGTFTNLTIAGSINLSSGTIADFHASSAGFAAGALATPSIYNLQDRDTGIFFPSAGAMVIGNNGAITSSMTASGMIIEPRTSAFLVSNETERTDVTGDATNFTIPWGTEEYDQANEISGATATWTVTGRYLCTVLVRANGLTSSHSQINVHVLTSNRTYNFKNTTSPAGLFPISVSTYVDADANDTIAIYVMAAGSTKVVDVDGVNNIGYFGCSLIH